MPKSGIKVQISLEEIYNMLCPKCKKKLRKFVKDRIAEHLTNDVLHAK